MICKEDFTDRPSMIGGDYCSNKCSSIGRRKIISKEELHEMYYEKQLSTVKISKILDVNNTSVGKWMKIYGMKTVVGREGKKNKGKPISEECKRKISEAHKKKRADHHFSGRKNPMFSKPFSDKQFKLTRGGFREDISLHVRSSWEANYTRYLKFLKENGKIQDFEYENETFKFENEQEKPYSFTPDFKVYSKEGVCYHEVKGVAKTRDLKINERMKKYFPNVKIKYIFPEDYKKIQNEYGCIIKNWERPTPPSKCKKRNVEGN